MLRKLIALLTGTLQRKRKIPVKQPKPMLLPRAFDREEWKGLLDIYDRYRDYTKHEDDLINQRSTWHLILQGFLFASFGVFIQSEKTPTLLFDHRIGILRGFTILGAAIAAAACFGIYAAAQSVDRLWDEWKNNVIESGWFQKDLTKLFPGLAGAGSKYISFCGVLPARLIPLLVLIAWCLLLWQTWFISPISPPIPPPQTRAPHYVTTNTSAAFE